MSGWTAIWVLFFAAGAGSAVWYTAPKGPNQVLIRWSAVMTLACCYIMWVCVYMAQLHPLIQPTRGDVRFLE
ncbi:Similar to S.cerevisiae protein VMA9 (Vacuolar H+ ATPase subunit e of the V-ATPase V0 subcomplex) [Malassezia sympodialis ATCC 42132]|uniref:Similar to S.cerevisiae protein VMA9 (Vacuolar H+ ATPase subunit e of the V-ATPase V0 subcomplex) n=1 Tax=Malassezia sympodialis (strain ATCC 42132) TaxID=1230383 RepID=A0A1M8A7I6_MALS4|nr:Similar to S.cerevisiae protein VMA9 (Vacuolar H+ ATPase subunit e of the V-ATPase V0 subcomplex) [Malassezia sympodialis ATCC 42132]